MIRIFIIQNLKDFLGKKKQIDIDIARICLSNYDKKLLFVLRLQSRNPHTL